MDMTIYAKIQQLKTISESAQAALAQAQAFKTSSVPAMEADITRDGGDISNSEPPSFTNSSPMPPQNNGENMFIKSEGEAVDMNLNMEPITGISDEPKEDWSDWLNLQ